MASTWDRKGGNEDGTDFKDVSGGRNVLLDADGPGCIHRIFTGRLGGDVAGTRIRIFFDGQDRPALDYPVEQFFADRGGPFPYPLVFHKSYPGLLFPLPFARHCRIELANEQGGNWGNYWQITWTRYAPGVPVRTLAWPLSAPDQAEVRRVCEAWLLAESQSPDVAGARLFSRPSLGPGEEWEITLDGSGTIDRLQASVSWPRTIEAERLLRVRARWDGSPEPSIDAPFSYLFGEVDPQKRSETRFNSLPLGTTTDEACLSLPMPFAAGARIGFRNDGREKLEGLSVRLRVRREAIPATDWGRLHATWTQAPAATPASRRWGRQQVPVHTVLETFGPGKYVGVLLAVDWPSDTWWGEGDWLIWTDESDWPPSYHGTGSEEYFNSGWCRFDRKAVSGFIRTHPGEAANYTFHLNDAFQFRRNIRVAEEQMGFKEAQQFLETRHPSWSSTAFWYAVPARAAGSTPRWQPSGQQPVSNPGP
jgi:hypothetical protein